MSGYSIIEVDDADLGQATAEWIAERLIAAIHERDVAHLAVSGGATPWLAFQVLAGLDVPWGKVHVWQVDERVAPDLDPARNATGLRRSLLDAIAVGGRQGPALHLMQVGTLGAEEAAARYGEQLEASLGPEPVLDVVHLGIGADGHTASWVPDDDVIDASSDVAVTSSVYQGTRRVTLTPPCVNRARTRVFMVQGHDKAAPLRRMLAGDPLIPASRVTSEGSTIITSTAVGA